MTVRALWGVSLVLISAGCNVKTVNGSPVALTRADLKPDQFSGESATMRFGDKEMRTDVVQSRRASDFIMELRAYGVTLEREVYRATDQEFAIVEILEEQYTPPLPLVRFPLAIPQELKWSGEISTAGIQRKASAVVLASISETSPLPKSEYSVWVHVDLKLETGGPKPSLRELDFWFVPGNGIQRRTFGKALERKPDLVELN